MMVALETSKNIDFLSFCFVVLNPPGADDSENRRVFSNWFVTGDTVSSGFKSRQEG